MNNFVNSLNIELSYIAKKIKIRLCNYVISDFQNSLIKPKLDNNFEDI